MPDELGSLAPAAAPVPAAPAAEDDHDDLGATLEANWDKAEAAPSTASPAAPASPAVQTGIVKPTDLAADGRARGPDGKFIQKPEAPAGGVVAAPEFKIPEKWPTDVRAKLEAIHKVNPEHAQYVLEQYEHFRRIDGQREQKVSDKLKGFDDLLAPGREARALKNIDETTYVRNLIAAGNVLDKTPEEGLRYLAKHYGVDLAKLANPDASGQQPVVSENEQVLQKRLDQVEAFLASQHQQAAEHQLNQAASWIEGFAKAADASGRLLYPYFDECLDEIIVIVGHQKESGRTIDVKAAYDKAVRMNDSVWLKEQTAKSEASKKEAEARRLRDIEDARKAGFSVSGSGAQTVDAAPDDLGANLERNYDKFVRS